MRRAIKATAWVLGVLLVLALVLAAFLPLAEFEDRYCIYCGYKATQWTTLGILWPQQHMRDCWHDGGTVPEHEHAMLRLCGGKTWLYKGGSGWDSFGWPGNVYRKVLKEALAARPAESAEIMAAYMAIDPHEHPSKSAFFRKYGPARSSDIKPSSPD